MEKRLVDFLVSLGVLVVFSPVILLIAILIRLDSEGPVFFRQWRVGRRERLFRIMKFRTMVVDAEKKGPVITTGDDPRVTRVGAFLRHYRLDELPNFVNILIGDMSLVGPRPELPKFIPFYTPMERAVFAVSPGLTDLGTIRFIDEAKLLKDAQDAELLYVTQILPVKRRLNLEYVRRQSFTFDILILLNTIRLVFDRSCPMSRI